MVDNQFTFDIERIMNNIVRFQKMKKKISKKSI